MMEAVAILGGLMGLAFVSGLRLYSTVLAIGLGIRLGYLVVPEDLNQLHMLARPSVLTAAGILYTLEFFADKIPWIDTIWDAVHTFIRPIGAAILAATAVGPVDPVVKLGVAMLCGGIALSSHSAKAGTRVLVNHSPEPFSNIGLSLAEDTIVLSGVWLALRHPVVSALIVTTALALIVWLIPRLVRVFRRQVTKIIHFTKARVTKAPRPAL